MAINNFRPTFLVYTPKYRPNPVSPGYRALTDAELKNVPAGTELFRQETGVWGIFAFPGQAIQSRFRDRFRVPVDAPKEADIMARINALAELMRERDRLEKKLKARVTCNYCETPLGELIGPKKVCNDCLYKLCDLCGSDQSCAVGIEGIDAWICPPCFDKTPRLIRMARGWEADVYEYHRQEIEDYGVEHG